MAEHLGRAVVEVGLEHGDGVGLPVAGGRARAGVAGFAEDGAEDVGAGAVVARAEAVADAAGREAAQGAEAFGKLREQGRAGGRDEFVRLLALGHRHAACTEDFQRRRRGDGDASVCAPHPAGAFDHRRGEHARAAERLERDARAHDVHDGIHRTDFVEMHLLGRQTVNLSFRHRDALEDGDGFSFTHGESVLA